MHHNRHKEILRIVRQISAHDIDQLSSILPPSKADNEGKGRRESTTTISIGTGTATDTASESTGMEEAKMTRRERKKSKKNGNSTPRTRRDVESFPMEELDFVSEALHLSIHESKGAWQGTYVYDHKQESFDVRCTIEEDEEPRTLDSEMTSSSIYDLAVKAPTELTPRQRKTLKKYMPPINHSSYGGGSRKFSPHALLQEAVDPFDGVDPAIFFRLGVEIVNPAKNSKTRKDLVAKLVAAAKEDIDIITREDKETEMREAGFWRWAGKTAWHVMKETRRTLDWATGQKINDPRPEDFVDDGIDIGADFAEDDIDEPKPPEPETPDVRQTKREVVVEESLSPSPNWKTVPSKKSAGTSKKKVKRGITTALKFNNSSSNKSFDPVKEEGVDEECDDMGEMLTRYQQQMSGERNIGRGPQPTTPDYRRAGRKVATLKLK